MKIKILAIGRVREKYLNDGIAEYTKRLRPYCNITIQDFRDKKAPEKLSKAQVDKILEDEGDSILKAIKPADYVIALAIEGKMMDSVKLADKFKDLTVTGKSTVAFVIGGSLGLSNDVKKRADMLLSFSKFTFPHQLMRLVLVEQVYRVFKIWKGEPYHK